MRQDRGTTLRCVLKIFIKGCELSTPNANSSQRLDTDPEEQDFPSKPQDKSLPCSTLFLKMKYKIHVHFRIKGGAQS